MSADLLTVVSDYTVFLLLSDVHYLVYQSEIGPKHLWSGLMLEGDSGEEVAL